MRNQAPTQVFQFDLISLDRSTGKVAWQKTLRKELPHEGHHGDHGYASYSPVTDGKHIVAFYGSRGLHCTTMSGEILWQKDLGKMQTRNGFGEGSSPALSGNTAVIIWDHEGEDFVAAFAVDTGKELWRQKRDEPTTWTTPLIVNQGGVEQAIVAATNRTRSYELKSGKVLWEAGGQTTNVIPTPVTADGVVYVMSGFRGAALQAIKLGGSGDLTSGNAMLWQHNKNTPYGPSPLLSGNRLYFFSGNNGILSCLNVKDGKPLMDAERIEGAAGFYASPVAAAGRVYLADRNGTTFVIKDADRLEVLATNKLDEKFDASPAIVGNEIYLRGHSHLYCISAGK
jgi:outer membrane protein assembly factor BamB